MDIKFRGIINEVNDQSPWVGAVILAPSCSLGCKGCYNKDLKKGKPITCTAEHIIELVKQNPSNEGIILGGLEWSESVPEMLELCKEASKQGLKVMIHTGLELMDFHYRIGYQSGKKLNIRDLPKGFPERELYCHIGAGLLDSYIPDTYWIKTGRYDKSKVVDNNIQFGVKLATSNQRLIEIRKADEEDIKDDDRWIDDYMEEDIEDDESKAE